MHQTPPDANQKVTEFEAWVKISERTSLFCEFMDKPQLSIWDDAGDAEELSTSSGSGLKREVTPGVTTSSSSQQQPPPTTATKEEINFDELRQKLEEQDMVDSLEDALEHDAMAEASNSVTPMEKRRRKRRNKIELEPGPLSHTRLGNPWF